MAAVCMRASDSFAVETKRTWWLVYPFCSFMVAPLDLHHLLIKLLEE
jgi:hypothetical protein